MRPPDERLGRTLAHGRFEVVEWVGTSEMTGVAVAIDHQLRAQSRVTNGGDVAASIDDLRPRLCRDVAGLAPVTYLGPVASDDGWGDDGILMAELLPQGRPFEMDERAWPEQDVARFGRQLCATLLRVHGQGMVLGTVRPESLIVDEQMVTIVGRGERLWLLPKPNATKAGNVEPYRPGYRAPEVAFAERVLDDPEPSADVFSVGVILAELLLGRFPFAANAFYALLESQYRGNHLPLPATLLGTTLSRAISSLPEKRPALAELDAALQSI